ncbi:unnamed protein product [Moneuplotes crassus]|uniref:Uncharacterized protein n=1 Tax=Euplotes crassus TaxID=5936 RepID=A0AAD2DCX9_EUPCR|nr:unnamed protein product [Moneuplotes crassus]
MHLLQKAYFYLNQNKQVGNILKTHLDFAAQEMIQEVNLQNSAETKIDMNNIMKFGETIKMNNLFPDETSQSYDLMKNYERIKTLHKEYGLIKNKNRQKILEISTNEDKFDVPLEMREKDFIEYRKLQAEENCLKYVMDRDGKIENSHKSNMDHTELAREIIEPRFKMFIEHCKINHLKTFKDNINMFNTH